MTNAYQTLLEQHLREKQEKQAIKEVRKAEKKKGPGVLKRSAGWALRNTMKLATTAYLSTQALDEIKKGRVEETNQKYLGAQKEYQAKIVYEYIAKKDPNFKSLVSFEEFRNSPELPGIEQKLRHYGEAEKAEIKDLKIKIKAANAPITGLEAQVRNLDMMLASPSLTDPVIRHGMMVTRNTTYSELLQRKSAYDALEAEKNELESNYIAALNTHNADYHDAILQVGRAVGPPPVPTGTPAPRSKFINAMEKLLVYHEAFRNASASYKPSEAQKAA